MIIRFYSSNLFVKLQSRIIRYNLSDKSKHDSMILNKKVGISFDKANSSRLLCIIIWYVDSESYEYITSVKPSRIQGKKIQLKKKRLYRSDNELDNGSYDTSMLLKNKHIACSFMRNLINQTNQILEKNQQIKGHGNLLWKRPVAAYFDFSHINECLSFRYHKAVILSVGMHLVTVNVAITKW